MLEHGIGNNATMVLKMLTKSIIIFIINKIQLKHFQKPWMQAHKLLARSTCRYTIFLELTGRKTNCYNRHIIDNNSEIK